jgi:hypothetical protein
MDAEDKEVQIKYPYQISSKVKVMRSQAPW